MKTTIDITSMGQQHPNGGSRCFYHLNHGKELAIKTNLAEHLEAGDVDIVLRETFGLAHCIDVSFLSGFFGPIARKIGMDVFINRVSLNGIPLNGKGPDFLYRKRCYIWVCTTNWIEKEQKRKIKAEQVKARSNHTAKWSPCMRMLIPEIGTIINLADDWTFRLYNEYRNADLLKQLGIPVGRWDEQHKNYEVVIHAPAEMSVDRMYIRKGASDYSSLTFYLKQGAEVTWHQGVGQAKKIITKGKTRFWAKLKDVNRMNVMVDLNTLAET